MNTQHITQLQADYLLNTYAAKLVLTKGEGSKVWDNDGNEYLDFTSGISVCNVGHCHPTVTQAIQEQAGKLVHVSNLYVNELQPRLAAQIIERSYDGRVFFANSGAEANEGMIKFARKWGHEKGRYEIICMEHNFHGRTLAALSATDKPAIKAGFDPLVEGFSFVPYNNVAAIEAAITDKTAAVLLEPIQGEGGVFPADSQYMSDVRALCDKHGILLLFDEVQTGFGRTGTMFGFQNFDVTPDAMSLAKGIANGYPMGAFVVARKWETVMQPGSHATTFGGTPLACAAALAVLQVMDDEDVLHNVLDQGAYLTGEFVKLAKSYPQIKDVRGPGLMLGIQFDSLEQAAEVIAKAAEKGLLLVGAAGGVVRVYPPLNVDRTTLEQGIEILNQALGELS
ncbi:hypothetical protein BVY04_00070 [bacterium M21]|nr:hypothetical protein BVY04_00070 [bacterium M21]